MFQSIYLALVEHNSDERIESDEHIEMVERAMVAIRRSQNRRTLARLAAARQGARPGGRHGTPVDGTGGGGAAAPGNNAGTGGGGGGGAGTNGAAAPQISHPRARTPGAPERDGGAGGGSGRGPPGAASGDASRASPVGPGTCLPAAGLRRGHGRLARRRPRRVRPAASPVRTIPNHGDRDPDDLSRRDGYLAGALRACCERSRAGKPLGSWGRGGVRPGRSPGATDKVTATAITPITAMAPRG